MGILAEGVGFRVCDCCTVRRLPIQDAFYAKLGYSFRVSASLHPKASSTALAGAYFGCCTSNRPKPSQRNPDWVAGLGFRHQQVDEKIRGICAEYDMSIWEFPRIGDPNIAP